MKNCIYYTYYGDKRYSELLKISLVSLNKFFNKEHIYVFTDLDIEDIDKYCNIVKHNFSKGYAKPMAERYNIIKLLSDQYHGILQLDCDTVCISDVNKIFECLKNNKISVATEKEHNGEYCIGSCWAGPLLTEEEKKKYSKIKSICAGVFACNNTFSDYGQEIYTYISKIEESGFRGSCADQHAFCKFIIEKDLYDFSLQKYVYHDGIGLFKRNEQDKIFETDVAIVHFAGGVQPAEIKKIGMNQLMRKCDDRNN